MTTRVAINGFGRIGRAFLRVLLSQPAPELEVVAVNDLTEPDNLAYLLQFDSAYGRLPQTVSAVDGHLQIGSHLKVRVLAERDPAQLPWKDLGVDLVVESTGLFTKRDGAAKHLEAGAKKVIISAPAKGPDLTVVMEQPLPRGAFWNVNLPHLPAGSPLPERDPLPVPEGAIPPPHRPEQSRQQARANPRWPAG